MPIHIPLVRRDEQRLSDTPAGLISTPNLLPILSTPTHQPTLVEER